MLFKWDDPLSIPTGMGNASVSAAPCPGLLLAKGGGSPLPGQRVAPVIYCWESCCTDSEAEEGASQQPEAMSSGCQALPCPAGGCGRGLWQWVTAVLGDSGK